MRRQIYETPSGMQQVVTSLFCWLPRDNKTVHNTRVPNSATVAPVGATLRMRQNRLVTYLRKRSIQKGPGCRHAARAFLYTRRTANSPPRPVIVFSSCRVSTGRSGDRSGRSTLLGRPGYADVRRSDLSVTRRSSDVSRASCPCPASPEGGAGCQQVKVASGCPTSTM
jgi:hypothetical protein